MITGKKIHEAFNVAASDCYSVKKWEEISLKARTKYTQMATYLNQVIGLPQPCPFCRFYEHEPEPVGSGKIAEVGACDACSEANAHADITEFLLEWLEEQEG